MNPEIEEFSDSCGQMHDASEQDNRFRVEASGVFSSNEGETNSRSHSKKAKRHRMRLAGDCSKATLELPGGSDRRFPSSDPSGAPPYQVAQ